MVARRITRPVRLYRSAGAIAVGVALVSNVASADADDRIFCSLASEKGQTARDQGKLREARESFEFCARDACPKVVREDCATWLKQVDAQFATVILSAQGPQGQKLTDLDVSVDGEPILTGIDGGALTVEPGPHKFVFRMRGRPPIEVDIVIAPGEKNHAIVAAFPEASNAPASTPAPSSSAPTTASSSASTAASSSDSAPTKSVAPWVIGAAGIGALGVGITFYALGMGDRSSLASSCGQPRANGKGTCTDDQISSARTKLVVGDVAVGAGVIALGIAATLFLMDNHEHNSEAPKSERTKVDKPRWTGVDAHPLPGGGALVVNGSF